MTSIWIESVSLFAPGLNGWSNASSVLREPSTFCPDFIPAIESRFLTPTHRRRTSPHMHIAVQAADYALRNMAIDETSIELIVTTSESDLDIAEDNMQALIHNTKEISPQKFQNVILNAAAGHLGIFMKNTSGSTTVSGSDNCFAVGLLQAFSTVMAGQENVLLVAHDAPSMMPYGFKERPYFGVGLLLNRSHTKSAIAGLSFTLVKPKQTTQMEHPPLEVMRKSAPAAACLPVLEALAQKSDRPVELYYSNDLALVVSLCF